MAENKDSESIDYLSKYDLSAFEEESSSDLDYLSKYDLSAFEEDDDSDPLKKKDELVSGELSSDSSTNTTGQTSTISEPSSNPLDAIYQELGLEEIGVTYQDFLTKMQSPDTRSFVYDHLNLEEQGFSRDEYEREIGILAQDPVVQSMQQDKDKEESFIYRKEGEEQAGELFTKDILTADEGEVDYDRAIRRAMNVSDTPDNQGFSGGTFVTPISSQDAQARGQAALDFVSEMLNNAPETEKDLILGAFSRQAPNQYKEYLNRAARNEATQERLEEYRKNKVAGGVVWTPPETTPKEELEYNALSAKYNYPKHLMKWIKDGKNKEAIEMLTALDEEGRLKEVQSKGLNSIRNTLKYYPINHDVIKDALKQVVRADKFYSDAKKDDNAFMRGVESTAQASRIADIALRSEPKETTEYLEFLYQTDRRTEPRKDQGMISKGLEMLGGVAPTMGATIGTSIVTSPVVGAAVSTAAYAQQGYGQGLQEAYFKARKQGFSKETSYQLAQSQAIVSSIGSGGEGFLGALSVVKLPVKGFLGKAASHILDLALDAGFAGGSKLAQNIHGESLGLDYTTFEGVPENMLSEAMFGFGVKGVTGGVKFGHHEFSKRFGKLAADKKLEVLARLDRLIEIEAQNNPNILEVSYGKPQEVEGSVEYGKETQARELTFTEKLQEKGRAKQVGRDPRLEPTPSEPVTAKETPVEMTPKEGERMSIYDLDKEDVKNQVQENFESTLNQIEQAARQAIVDVNEDILGKKGEFNTLSKEEQDVVFDEYLKNLDNIDESKKKALNDLANTREQVLQEASRYRSLIDQDPLTEIKEDVFKQELAQVDAKLKNVGKEVDSIIKKKAEKPKEDIEVDIDLDELSALEKEIEASEGQGSLLDNLGQRAFMGGEEGMIQVHPDEPNTIIFETNERRIDLSKTDFEKKKKKDMQEAQDKIDELENMSDEDAVKKYGKDGVKERDKSIKEAKEYKEGLESEKLLSDFDISLMSPEGVVVLPKGETVEVTRTAKGKTETSTVEVDVMDSDGQKYQIEYERRPKKGSRFVRAKNVENGQVKVFKGEQAERILKGIDLREGKVLKASKLKDDPTQSTDVKERLVSEKTPQKGTPVTQELEGTEPTVRTGEGIREGDQTATRGDVEAAIKRLEQDIEDTKNKVFQEREQRAREAEERLIASKKRDQEANVKRAKERDLTPEQRKQKALSEQQVLDEQKKVVEALVEKQKLFADAREIWDSLTPEQRTKIEEQFDDLIKIYDEEAKIFEDLVNAEAKKKKRLKEDIVEAEFEFKDRKRNVVKGKGEFEVRQEGNTTKVFEIVDGETIPLDAKPPETENLIEVGDAMFQVRKKADGTLSVSQANENNKFVTVSKYKDGKGNPLREKVEALFKQEEARQQEEFFLQQKKKAAARRAFKESKDLQYVKTEIEAETEIDAFKKGQQDETLKKLDKLIAEAGQEFRDGLARQRAQMNMFWQAVGDFSKLSVPAVKYLALQMVKAGYKAKKGLSVAIKETYDYLKSKDLYTGSETQFKKWAIAQLKNVELETKGDTDPKAKTKGTGRTGTTKTKDTDGGQDKGKQPRAKGKDKKSDAVLPKEESTVQDSSPEIDKGLKSMSGVDFKSLKDSYDSAVEKINETAKSFRSAFKKGFVEGKGFKKGLEQQVLNFVRENLKLGGEGYKQLANSLKEAKTEVTAIRAIEKAIESVQKAELKAQRNRVKNLIKDAKKKDLLKEYRDKLDNILDIIDEKILFSDRAKTLQAQQDYFTKHKGEQQVLDFVRDNFKLSEDSYKKLTNDLKQAKTESEAIKAVEKAVEGSQRVDVESKIEKAKELINEGFVEGEGFKRGLDVPLKLQKQFDRLKKVGINELSSEALIDLENDINDIIERSNQKKALLKKQKEREKDSVYSDLLEQSKDKEAKKSALSSQEARDQKAKEEHWWTSYKTNSLNPLTLTEKLDEGKEGWFTKYFYKNQIEGENKKMEIMSNVEKVVQKVMGDLDMRDYSEASSKNVKKTKYNFRRDKAVERVRNGRIYRSKSDARPVELTKGEELWIYMASLNENMRNSMMNGGLAFRGDETNMFFLTEQDLQNITEKVLADPVLKKSAEAINKANKEIVTPAVSKTYKDITGEDLVIEENYVRKVVNPYTRAGMSRVEAQKFLKDFDKAVITEFQGLENRGFTKQRQSETVGLIIEDAYAGFIDSSKRAAEYAGQAKAVLDAKELLGDFKIRKLIEDKYKVASFKYLESLVKDLDIGQIQKDATSKFFDYPIKKLPAVALTYNARVVLYQLASYSLVKGEVGDKYLNQALANTLIGKGMTMDEVKDISPLMHQRDKGFFDIEVGNMASFDETSLLFTGKKAKGSGTGMNKKIIDAGLSGISWMDTKTVKTIWDAVRLELLDTKYKDGIKGREAEFNADLKEKAEHIVRKTQPTYSNIDRAGFSRSDRDLVKNLSMFYTQRAKIANMIVSIHTNTNGFKNWTPKTRKQAIGIIKSAVNVALIKVLWDELWDAISSDEDKKEKEDDLGFISKVSINTANNLLSLPYFSSFVTGAGKAIAGERYFPVSDPVIDFFDTLGNMVYSSTKLLIGEGSKGDIGKVFDASMDLMSLKAGVNLKKLTNLGKMLGIDIKKELQNLKEDTKNYQSKPSSTRPNLWGSDRGGSSGKREKLW